jgi:hypothetical protein
MRLRLATVVLRAGTSVVQSGFLPTTACMTVRVAGDGRRSLFGTERQSQLRVPEPANAPGVRELK